MTRSGTVGGSASTAPASRDPHDFRLHDFLIHASRNGRLIRMLATLRSQVSAFQIQDTGYPHRMEGALDDHERILLALIAGHTEQAAEHLAVHIDNSASGVLTDIFNGPAQAEEGGRG